MYQTYTKLRKSSCILNEQSKPNSAWNGYVKYVLLPTSWISEDGPNWYRTWNISMYFKSAKYSEFDTLCMDYWHPLEFRKMGRTYTALEISPCISNGQSMPNSAQNWIRKLFITDTLIHFLSRIKLTPNVKSVHLF